MILVNLLEKDGDESEEIVFSSEKGSMLHKGPKKYSWEIGCHRRGCCRPDSGKSLSRAKRHTSRKFRRKSKQIDFTKE